MLNKNVFHQIYVKKNIRLVLSLIKLHVEEYKVKLVQPIMIVIKNGTCNVQIFGRMIIFKKILDALKSLSVIQR